VWATLAGPDAAHHDRRQHAAASPGSAMRLAPSLASLLVADGEIA